MTLSEQKQKIEAAYKLLSEESTTLEKFDSASKLLIGINPKIDKNLQTCSKVLLGIENIQSGEVIDLFVKNFPENTPEEKRRKKAILLFIKYWKDLRNEVSRIKGELDEYKGQEKSVQQQITSFGKIAAFAKGPFGIITLAALIIATSLVFLGRNGQPKSTTENQTQSPLVSAKPKIQVITFNGKKIPLSELTARTGPDCKTGSVETEHYHAKNGQFTKALDGTQISDPGACAYGKVEGTNIEEIQTP